MPRTASAIGTRNSLTTLDTEAEPAKVTVKVEPGPLYHVASVNGAGARRAAPVDPRTKRKLPLKPGDPARTAPVVATETALLAALGDSGHPFAKVEDRRVEIDKDEHTMEVTYTLDPGPAERFGPLAIDRARAAQSRLCRGTRPLAARRGL